jgi:hypothetical protein
MKIKAKLSFLGSFLYFLGEKPWEIFVFFGGVFCIFFRGKNVGEFLGGIFGFS